MTDTGLRVTEVVRLQVKNFNLQEKTVTIQSLKKRATSKAKKRTIPLTNRVLDAFATYWLKLPSRDPEDYLFPASVQSNQPHLSRKVVWRRLKK